MTDLGASLAMLGDLNRGVACYDKAVSCFEYALHEMKIKVSPHDFAETQLKIGDVFQSRATLSSKPELFDAALQALDAAQIGIPRETCPARLTTAEIIRATIAMKLGTLGKTATCCTTRGQRPPALCRFCRTRQRRKRIKNATGLLEQIEHALAAKPSRAKLMVIGASPISPVTPSLQGCA